jgi:hypothetical protein
MNKYDRTTAIFELNGITVSYQIFVKPKTKNSRISNHLKVTKRCQKLV